MVEFSLELGSTKQALGRALEGGVENPGRFILQFSSLHYNLLPTNPCAPIYLAPPS
jgi:hypothetical protein